MSNIYISNEKIISQFYSGYQPFPRSWEIDKEGSRAALIFGPNKIELTNEIWKKIFVEIMIVAGICSEETKHNVNVMGFDVNSDKSGGVIVEFLYDIENYRIS